MNPSSKTLRIYAVLLLAIGAASVLFDPIVRAVTLYTEGKTGLIVCGIAAALAVTFSRLIAAGTPWARWAGLALSFILLSYCGPKAFSLAKAVSAGIEKGHIWYKATLFAIIAVVSLWATVSQFVNSRQNDPAPRA
jgi:hypothetical protein